MRLIWSGYVEKKIAQGSNASPEKNVWKLICSTIDVKNAEKALLLILFLYKK